jgi:hypothetical protein
MRLNLQFTTGFGFGAQRALSPLRGIRRWMLAFNSALRTTLLLLDDDISKLDLHALVRVGSALDATRALS